MSHIKFDYSKVLDKFVAPHEVEYMQAQVTAADELIRKGTGAGSDFLGWLDLPENYDREEFDRILKAAEQIKSDSDVLVVIGIGGSYLGAKAAIGKSPTAVNTVKRPPTLSGTTKVSQPLASASTLTAPLARSVVA